MMGAVGGMVIALVVGAILEATGSYALVFVMASLAYLLALAVIHALSPDLAAVEST
jgi:ACS family hexuronate transporter-like MFS transporter